METIGLFNELVQSPVGNILLTANETALLSCEIFNGDLAQEIQPSNTITQLASKELAAYFVGALKEFTVPLHFIGSDFQQQVWQQLQTITYGKTITYKQQALQLNNYLGIRAIAKTNGANKHLIIVPCHRVLGSNGSLTGFAVGVAIKEWLLNHEAKFVGNYYVQKLF
jgi:O-6-methylguanine DNA methyltransferase